MRKMFQYRLFPNKKQLHQLNETLEECRWLYNYLLAERKNTYEQEKKSLSLYEQQETFGILKAARPTLKGVHSQVLQNVAVRVDLAFKAFFRRVKEQAEEAGRQFVKVNPAYTTQDCSKCHHRQKMPLSERTYHCPSCLLSIDRDLSAALNIRAVGLHDLGMSLEGPAFMRGK